MRVFITGGTGLIGRALAARLLERGDDVVVLTRDAELARSRLPAGVDVRKTDPMITGPWQQALGECDAAVNLAGESIAEGRWTEGKKRRLRQSRLVITGHVAEAVRAGESCRVLVSASASGYYGDRGAEAMTENHEPGDGFLARLAHEWESAALKAADERTRVACPRIGIVLAREGGALPRMATAFRLGLGGPLGDGRQYFPWIHIRDLVSSIVFALDHDEIAGAFNAAAPDPPSQEDFARALCARLGRPCIMRVPGFALRMVLGEFGGALLASQRAVPNALKAAGFRFEFSEIEAALDDLVG